jgi:hypothetical protein
MKKIKLGLALLLAFYAVSSLALGEKNWELDSCVLGLNNAKNVYQDQAVPDSSLVCDRNPLKTLEQMFAENWHLIQVVEERKFRVGNTVKVRPARYYFERIKPPVKKTRSTDSW